jgi:asparagine synthase (glutamine-hydrolysing)
MCGIVGLIRARGNGAASTLALRVATEIVRHRGPDDEGYLLWGASSTPRVFAGADTSSASRSEHRLHELPREESWRVGFGHRRLSIVDLSALGHQPMVHEPTGLAVCYNGEIYNHIELRHDLEGAGHDFRSHADTEVLLHAWLEWGPDCLQRLNGMFAFVLLDPRGGGAVHAVRDRFGVKPLYHSRVNGLLAFVSEIKQIRSLPGFAHRLDEGVARDYLAFGLVDHTERTFDVGIAQIRGGERASVRLDDPDLRVRIERWYDPKPASFRGGQEDAAVDLLELLRDSVRLRLRADVPVGSCLSGGLDSSAIVCLARQTLDTHETSAGQVTITACYEQERYDEWRYAELVVKQTGAEAVRVWPSVERLQAELDVQLWHLDEPVGSTSQFSQWCVFDGAANAGLKVMLDGQGSDEQLAGYGGSDAALYAGLLRRASILQLGAEAVAFRRRHGVLPLAQLILAARNIAPAIDVALPGRVRVARSNPDWLVASAPSPLDTTAARDLNDLLRQQLLVTSLPVLLRYEDRNSMAWSVESRVPFLDYRLVEFLSTVPATMKLKRGVTKAVFRDAMRGVLPEPIRTRGDKMGFVTPEAVWLGSTATEWFRDGIEATLDVAPTLFDRRKVLDMVEGTIAGTIPFSFEPWRILCFGRWVNTVAMGGERPASPASVVNG